MKEGSGDGGLGGPPSPSQSNRRVEVAVAFAATVGRGTTVAIDHLVVEIDFGNGTARGRDRTDSGRNGQLHKASDVGRKVIDLAPRRGNVRHLGDQLVLLAPFGRERGSCLRSLFDALTRDPHHGSGPGRLLGDPDDHSLQRGVRKGSLAAGLELAHQYQPTSGEEPNRLRQEGVTLDARSSVEISILDSGESPASSDVGAADQLATLNTAVRPLEEEPRVFPTQDGLSQGAQGAVCVADELLKRLPVGIGFEARDLGGLGIVEVSTLAEHAQGSSRESRQAPPAARVASQLSVDLEPTLQVRRHEGIKLIRHSIAATGQVDCCLLPTDLADQLRNVTAVDWTAEQKLAGVDELVHQHETCTSQHLDRRLTLLVVRDRLLRADLSHHGRRRVEVSEVFVAADHETFPFAEREPVECHRPAAELVGHLVDQVTQLSRRGGHRSDRVGARCVAERRLDLLTHQTRPDLGEFASAFASDEQAALFEQSRDALWGADVGRGVSVLSLADLRRGISLCSADVRRGVSLCVADVGRGVSVVPEVLVVGDDDLQEGPQHVITRLRLEIDRISLPVLGLAQRLVIDTELRTHLRKQDRRTSVLDPCSREVETHSRRATQVRDPLHAEAGEREPEDQDLE